MPRDMPKPARSSAPPWRGGAESTSSQSRSGLARGLSSLVDPSTSVTADQKASALHDKETRLDVHGFRVIDGHSGPVNYYEVVDESDPRKSFIHASYRPPLETVTLGYQVPDHMRQGVKRI